MTDPRARESFIVQVRGVERSVVVECCRTGERVRLERLEDIGRQIARWLEAGGPLEPVRGPGSAA